MHSPEDVYRTVRERLFRSYVRDRDRLQIISMIRPEANMNEIIELMDNLIENVESVNTFNLINAVQLEREIRSTIIMTRINDEIMEYIRQLSTQGYSDMEMTDRLRAFNQDITDIVRYYKDVRDALKNTDIPLAYRHHVSSESSVEEDGNFESRCAIIDDDDKIANDNDDSINNFVLSFMRANKNVGAGTVKRDSNYPCNPRIRELARADNIRESIRVLYEGIIFSEDDIISLIEEMKRTWRLRSMLNSLGGSPVNIPNMYSYVVNPDEVEYRPRFHIRDSTLLMESVEKMRFDEINKNRVTLNMIPLDISKTNLFIESKIKLPDAGYIKYLKSRDEYISDHKAIQDGKEDGIIICPPIAFIYVNGNILYTVNMNDFYVNMTRFYSTVGGMIIDSECQPKKDITKWTDTLKGKMLINTAKDRFPIVNHRAAEYLETDQIDFIYRITRRYMLGDCHDNVSYKGTYLHPSLAIYAARYVSDKAGDLLIKYMMIVNDKFPSELRVKHLDIQRYSTPEFRGKSLMLYRRTNEKHKPGMARISIGDMSRMKALASDPKVKVLALVIVVKNPECVIGDMLRLFGGKMGRSNKVDFHVEQNLKLVIEGLKDWEKYPKIGDWAKKVSKLRFVGPYKAELLRKIRMEYDKVSPPDNREAFERLEAAYADEIFEAELAKCTGDLATMVREGKYDIYVDKLGCRNGEENWNVRIDRRLGSDEESLSIPGTP